MVLIIIKELLSLFCVLDNTIERKYLYPSKNIINLALSADFMNVKYKNKG